MKFKVRRRGADLGEFTLEELKQKRFTSELSGDEYVQPEGALDWQPLDLVIESGYRTGLPAAPPLTTSDLRTQNIVWAVIVCVIVTIVAFGIFFVRLALQAQRNGFKVGQSQALQPTLEVPVAASRQPIVWATNSATAVEVNQRDREFRVRQWIDGYQQRGQHDPECEREELTFLQVWIARNYGGAAATNPISLEDESDKLAADSQCTDPLVLTVAAVNNRNLFQSRHCYERALAAFPASQHRAYPQLYATLMLADREDGDAKRQHDLEEGALPLLSKCFADGSFTPNDQQEIAELLVNGWGRHLFNTSASSVSTIAHLAGTNYQWLALCLDGEREIAEAWAARGGGYSDTVSDQGWKGFSSHLAAARTDLTAAWNLQPMWPLAPERMIYVSLGDSDIDEMRQWFDRTTTAQIDYDLAYRDFRWGLRPRWYGNHASLLAFGEAAVDTGRFDTDVPRKFFDAIQDVESELDLPKGRYIFGRHDIWPNLCRMYGGYIAAPSQADCRTGWRTSYAVVAYLAGKYDVARTQLAALDWQPLPENLTGWSVDLSDMTLEVAARTGSLGPKVSIAELQAHRREYAAALKIYQELAGANPDSLTAQYIKLRREQLGIAQQLQSGAWVDWLPADSQDLNWTCKLGEARTLPDGALEVEFGRSGHMLYSRVPVGDKFEVRGQFEVVHSSDRNFQAGLVMGVPDFNSYNWSGFRVKRHDEEGDVVSFSQGWSTSQVVKPATLDAVTNSFDFTYRAGAFGATVNGVRIFESTAPYWQLNVQDNSFLVGLGAFSDSSNSVIRYRDVQLRRIF
jgi:tetratricopeptide (TPR) repeat protein